jgi:hypothetical protein
MRANVLAAHLNQSAQCAIVVGVVGVNAVAALSVGALSVPWRPLRGVSRLCTGGAGRYAVQ